MSSPSKSIFHFKQFDVDQEDCAMKINTDGVLLGALAEADDPATILDIGTGTGVIALMLAQRFENAKIDAVEIDAVTAEKAGRNFANSPFANRLTAYAGGFTDFFEANPGRKYDLIVSNPPFYIDSLISPKIKKTLTKHADRLFFNDLIYNVLHHLTEQGVCYLVLPGNTSEEVKSITAKHNIFLQKNITIHSFKHEAYHREIVCLGLENKTPVNEKFVIYDQPKIYSAQYQAAMVNFFTIF